jgi:hypothetical protein
MRSSNTRCRPPLPRVASEMRVIRHFPASSPRAADLSREEMSEFLDVAVWSGWVYRKFKQYFATHRRACTPWTA